MDKNNQTSLAIVCHKPGESNSMEPYSKPMENSTTQIISSRSVRSGQISRPIPKIEHNRGVSNTKPRFLITNVCGARERQNPTDIELSKNKSVYTM